MPGRQRLTSAAAQVCLEVGQPFNPFRLFNGIFIPDALVRARQVSPGAKITYGRLTRYAGENGECYPAVATLASEFGMSERQTQRYLRELETARLIRRLPRVSESGQTSNAFVFLWHSIFADVATPNMTPPGVTDLSPEGVTQVSPKESQFEENQTEEKTTNKRIPGYASQKPRSAASSSVISEQEPESEPPKADGELLLISAANPSLTHLAWTQEELATVRQFITEFWGREPEEGFETSVMLKARGASAKAVCDVLRQKWANKKLRPGGPIAPRSQNWFLTIIENELMPGRLPEPAAPSRPEQEIADAEILERGIQTIELPDAPRSIVESVKCKECEGGALVQYMDGTIEGCGCRQRAAGA
jgi:hypothetical protein